MFLIQIVFEVFKKASIIVCMNKYDTLFEKYPDLFRERHLPATESCMCWGIGCGEGWFNLINDLCDNLDRLFKENNLKGDNYPSVGQVKEKFGGLRFYMTFKNTDEVIVQKAYVYIGEAEKKSLETCEVCGQPGKVCRGNWLKVTCDQCK
jgi:hypothetical protein